MSDHTLLHIELTGKTLYFAEEDLRLDNDTFYEGRLTINQLRSAYGEFLGDLPVNASLNVTLNNRDGGLDEDLEAYSWANRTVKIYGGSGTAWASYSLKYQGVLEYPNCIERDGRDVSLRIDDRRSMDFVKLPSSYFASGNPKPILYGQYADPCYLPLVLDTGDYYQIAEHEIKGFDGLYLDSERKDVEIYNLDVDTANGGRFRLMEDWHPIKQWSSDRLLRGGCYDSTRDKLFIEVQVTAGSSSELWSCDGTAFTQVKTFTQYTTAFLQEYDGDLYRAEYNKVYISTDGGENWSEDFDTGPVGAGNVTTLRTHPRGTAIYFGTTQGKLYWKNNGTWNLKETFTATTIHDIGFTYERWLEEAYVALNDGHIWQVSPKTDMGTPATGVAYACDGFGSQLCAAIDDELYRLLDPGDTPPSTAIWQKIGQAKQNSSVHNIYSMRYSETENKLWIGCYRISSVVPLFSYNGQTMKLENTWNSDYQIEPIVLYTVGSHEYVVTGPLAYGTYSYVIVDSKITNSSEVSLLARGRMDASNNLLEEPTDIIEDILKSYCGVAAGNIDSISKTTVRDYLKNGGGATPRIHRYVESASGADALIEEICRETGILLRIETDKYYFNHWKIAVSKTAEYSDIEIEKDSFQVRDFDFYANRVVINWKHSPATDIYNDSDMLQNTGAQTRDQTTTQKVLDFFWRYRDDDPITIPTYHQQLLDLCSTRLQIVSCRLKGSGISHQLAERVGIDYRFLHFSPIFIQETVDHLGRPTFGITGWSEDYLGMYSDTFWQTPTDKVWMPDTEVFETVETVPVAVHGSRVEASILLQECSARLQATRTGQSPRTSTVEVGGKTGNTKTLYMNIDDLTLNQYWNIELQLKKTANAVNPEASELVMLMR